MDTLNLDIDTYTHYDLTQLFSLSTKYTPKEVNDSKNKLIQQLKRLDGINTDKKLNIQMFVDNAASRLMNNEQKPDVTWSQRENIMVSTSDEHYVIEDNNRVVGKHSKTTEGRLGGTDNVPPGWLNPINVRSTHISINIDSRFRKAYNKTSSSDYSFDLPYIQKKVVNMRIASLEIPMSYYSVSRERGDATFIITTSSTFNISGVDYLLDYTDPSNIVTYSIDYATDKEYTCGWLVILPDGNYEMIWQSSSAAADIDIAINTALTNALPGLLFKESGKFLVLENSSQSLDVTFRVDRPSGRSHFSVTDDYNIIFSTDAGGSLINNVDTYKLQLYLGWQLGFREASYSISTDTPAISESVCLISGPRNMFVSVEDGVKNYGGNLVVAFTESIMQEPVITRINLTQTMNDERVYKIAADIGLETQLNRVREYFGPVTISKLKFKLLDEYGRIISLNNMDWSIVLVFEKLYD